jgi:hypothetical protein
LGQPYILPRLRVELVVLEKVLNGDFK